MLVSPRLYWPLAVFLVVTVVHALSENKTSWDSRWTLHTAMSVVIEKNTDLQEYADLLAANNNYAVEVHNDRRYNLFPLGPSLWAVPLVAAIDRVMRQYEHRSYQSELQDGRWSDVEELAATFAVAWTAVLMYLIGLACGLTRPRAFILSLVFAFATAAWSTASRALWQHGPSMLCLSLGLWSILRNGEQQRRRWLVVAGFALGLSFFMRPTNALAIVAFSLYVLWTQPRRFYAFALPGLAIGSLMLVYNLDVYHSILAPYYNPRRLSNEGSFWIALAGNLVSPARGVFVFSPILLLAPVGWMMWWRRGGDRSLLLTVAGIVIGHWIAISRFPHWWGGHCYGARFFTDMTPFLVFLLIPVLAAWPFGRLRQGGVVLLLAISVGISYIGANVPAVLEWNVKPVNIDEQPARLWDWGDAQFMRWR